MIKYKFFDKTCQIDREMMNHDNIEKNLRALGWDFAAINFVNQIHSNEVLVIDDESKIHGRQNLPKADAIVTNVANLAIGVVTADCSPIIIFDKIAKIVGVVHAGWPGALAGIVENAVLKMVDLGAKLDRVEVFIGPMIHQKSYQVSRDFYDDFLKKDEDNCVFFVDDKVDGKYLFDLVAFVENKLRQVGVENIENCNIDTYENESYASYRRACHAQVKKGARNISIAMIC